MVAGILRWSVKVCLRGLTTADNNARSAILSSVFCETLNPNLRCQTLSSSDYRFAQGRPCFGFDFALSNFQDSYVCTRRVVLARRISRSRSRPVKLYIARKEVRSQLDRGDEYETTVGFSHCFGITR